MELNRNYKQTDFGTIPVDWDCSSIKQLVDNGLIEKPLDGNHGNIHPKATDFVSHGIPFIMANDVNNGEIDLRGCHFIKKEQADRLQKGFSIEGDVLLTHKGTVGNVAIVGKIPYDYLMLTPQVTYYRVKRKDLISNQYIKHFFGSDKFQAVLLKLSGGGTRAYIGILNQQNLPFILPPIAEQTAIATVLSDTDALIISLEKLIAKKRNIKQGAMQEQLKPKKGWKSKQLGACLVENPEYGINAPSVPFQEALPTYLRITDISDDGKYLSRDKVSVAHSKATSYYLRKGDLVFARTGASVGKSYLYDLNDGKLVFAGFLIRVRPNPLILDSRFLKYYAQTGGYWNWVRENSMRSGQPGLNGAEFKQMHLDVPDVAEQANIAAILTRMDDELTQLQYKLEKIRQVKEGMMQTLLTGKIRLV